MRRQPVTTWLYNKFYGGDQLQQQGQALDQQLAQVNDVAYESAPQSVQDQVAADESSGSYASNYQAVSDQQTGNGAGMGLGSQNNFFFGLGGATGQGGGGNNASSLGALVKDVFLLAVIGGAIWLFFKIGGADSLKTLAKKGKYAVWGIVGAALLLAYYIYSKVKKTQTDASNTVSGVESGLASLNPFHTTTTSSS